MFNSSNYTHQDFVIEPMTLEKRCVDLCYAHLHGSHLNRESHTNKETETW